MKTEALSLRDVFQAGAQTDALGLVRKQQPASEVADQVTNPHAQGTSEAHERINTDRLLAAFHFANVHRMEVGLLSQPLLGELCPLAIFADGFADKFSLSWRCRHAPLAKQTGTVSNTVYNPLFCDPTYSQQLLVGACQDLESNASWQVIQLRLRRKRRRLEPKAVSCRMNALKIGSALGAEQGRAQSSRRKDPRVLEVGEQVTDSHPCEGCLLEQQIAMTPIQERHVFKVASGMRRRISHHPEAAHEDSGIRQMKSEAHFRAGAQRRMSVWRTCACINLKAESSEFVSQRPFKSHRIY